LALCDGGRALLKPGSTVRFQQMKDESYYLAGAGEVKAFNADGQEVMVSALTPPLVGGPLTQTVGPNGTTTVRRLSPVIAVGLASDPSSGLTALVGDQKVALPGGSPQRVALPNGAVLTLTWNVATRFLNCQVESGYFELAVEGIEGWRAAALAGQTVNLQWNVAEHSVSLQNVSSGGGLFSPVLVSPAPTLHVHVTLGATFQTTQFRGAEQFTTAAVGGEVTLLNASTGQQYGLNRQNLVFVGGAPETGADLRPSGGRTIVVGGTPKSVELSGDLGQRGVAAGRTEILDGAERGKLEATLDQTGELKLKAVVGRFFIRTRLDRTVAIRLEEGNTILLRIDVQQGVATVRGAAGHARGGATFVIRGDRANLDAAGGDALELRPDNPLTIVAARNGLMPNLEASRIFTEAAGASAPAGFSQASAPILLPAAGGRGPRAAFGQFGEQLDASRIVQVPLSTER
jgi:hypothetical protein